MTVRAAALVLGLTSAMAGGALAASSSAPAVSEQEWADDAPSWLRSIEFNGWRYGGLGVGGATAFLLKEPLGRAPNGIRQIWVRYESQNAIARGSYSQRSSTELVEFDCGEAKYRSRETTYYPENNLSGQGFESTAASAPAWRYVMPDTINGAVMEEVCRRSAPSPPAPDGP